MNQCTTILNELLHIIPRSRFENLVKTYKNDHYVKNMTSWHQFTGLLYAQASGKQSLRDVQQGLEVNHSRLYHLGIPVLKRSTLSDANNKRDYKVFQGTFYRLLEHCKEVTPKHRFKFKNPLHSIDSTVIDLCLSAFPWAKFKATKGAIRLHYDFNHSGCIPDFLVITDGKQGEIPVAKRFFPIIPDSIYCMDLGYTDFDFFRQIDEKKAFFVTRLRPDIKYTVSGQHAEPNKKGVLSDQIIQTDGCQSKKYADALRLIRYYDAETDKELQFLTNNFKLSAFTIAQIYKARWQIEIFFKWIKQNLKIKTFLGTSANAVLTQIWVAMIYYLLLAYIKYQSSYRNSLFYLHRVIGDTILTRCSIIDLFRASKSAINKLKGGDPQLCFL
jgi:hypothetical protein